MFSPRISRLSQFQFLVPLRPHFQHPKQSFVPPFVLVGLIHRNPGITRAEDLLNRKKSGLLRFVTWNRDRIRLASIRPPFPCFPSWPGPHRSCRNRTSPGQPSSVHTSQLPTSPKGRLGALLFISRSNGLIRRQIVCPLCYLTDNTSPQVKGTFPPEMS